VVAALGTGGGGAELAGHSNAELSGRGAAQLPAPDSEVDRPRRIGSSPRRERRVARLAGGELGGVLEPDEEEEREWVRGTSRSRGLFRDSVAEAPEREWSAAAGSARGRPSVSGAVDIQYDVNVKRRTAVQARAAAAAPVPIPAPVPAHTFLGTIPPR
jgi:hypothetical protein